MKMTSESLQDAAASISESELDEASITSSLVRLQEMHTAVSPLNDQVYAVEPHHHRLAPTPARNNIAIT